MKWKVYIKFVSKSELTFGCDDTTLNKIKDDPKILTSLFNNTIVNWQLVEYVRWEQE